SARRAARAARSGPRRRRPCLPRRSCGRSCTARPDRQAGSRPGSPLAREHCRLIGRGPEALARRRNVAGSVVMRVLATLAFALSLAPLGAHAQAPSGGALDPESYATLAADDEAQLTLGGFRGYLERIRPTDAALYAALDPRLDGLEERDVIADVIF